MSQRGDYSYLVCHLRVDILAAQTSDEADNSEGHGYHGDNAREVKLDTIIKLKGEIKRTYKIALQYAWLRAAPAAATTVEL